MHTLDFDWLWPVSSFYIYIPFRYVYVYFFHYLWSFIILIRNYNEYKGVNTIVLQLQK